MEKGSMELSKKTHAVLDRMEETRNIYHNIARSSAELIFILVKMIGARRIVEVGTGNGYSAIILGSAVSREGGSVETIERHGSMVELAKGNIKTAGLADIVTVRAGSGHKILKQMEEPIDVLFLDAAKQEYLGYLEHALPLLRPGSLLLADNIISHASDCGDFVEYVRGSDDFTETILPINSGLLIAVFRPDKRVATMKELMEEAGQRIFQTTPADIQKGNTFT